MALRFVAWLSVLASVAWAGTAREELVALRAKLAAQRQLGRSSGWAAQLRFAAARRRDPELAAEVMYDVALSQRQTDKKDAAKTLETLLQTHPKVVPWADLATYELARLHAERSSTRQKAIELNEKLLKAGRLDPVRRAQALMGVARLYQEASKHQEAMARYQAFIKEFPDHTSQCAEAVASTGMIFVALKQPKQAYETYLRLSADYPRELEQRRTLLLAVAQAFRASSDHEGAIAAYERLLQDLPQADSRRVQTYTGLAMLFVQKKEEGKAAAIYRRMALDKSISVYYRLSAYRYLFSLHRRSSDFAATIRLAYQIIATEPSRVLESSNIMGELVDALVAEGRVDEAVSMARAYFRLSHLVPRSSSSSRTSSSNDAILAVVRALKAKDGSLRRASDFIAFVERGPEGPDGRAGTADDVKDPLASFRLPSEAQRDRLFAEAARRLVTDPRQLAYLYICWDKPDEALRAFRRYYLQTIEATKVQAAASLLARAMRTLGRPESEVGAFFDFQNYGPKGKDGKPNTRDDLKDPLLKKK